MCVITYILVTPVTSCLRQIDGCEVQYITSGIDLSWHHSELKRESWIFM